jgi:hypothetical protein
MNLEPGKVLEFVEAIEGTLTHWNASQAVVPPTFLTTAFFAERRVEGADVKERIAFDPARSVHAEQIFVFHGTPPSLGSRLTGQSRVDRIYEKTNRHGAILAFVDVVTDFCDEEGVLRATSTMRAIEFPEADA